MSKARRRKPLILSRELTTIQAPRSEMLNDSAAHQKANKKLLPNSTRLLRRQLPQQGGKQAVAPFLPSNPKQTTSNQPPTKRQANNSSPLSNSARL